jgi:Tetratricopeptide repeat/Dolichyl-phosphate-mannose-protein mannosyltransferase
MTTDTKARFAMYDLRLWSRAIVDRKSQIGIRTALLLLVLVGVALRLWLISFSPLDPSFSTADDGDYYQRAFRFAVTGQYIDDGWLIRPPLHVLFFALWLRLAVLLGHPQLGVPLIQLAQTALGALTVMLGYGVARRLFASTRAGLLFAAFLALWFPFVEQASVFFSELLYLFLFLLHYWLLLRFDAGGRRRDLALSGVALGAAALTRSPALYSLAFVVLWLLLRQVAGRRSHFADARSPDHSHFSILNSQFANVLLVVACCLAVVLPWTIRNYLVYERFIPIDTLGQINMWLDLGAVSDRNDHIAELRRMPQADRQAYALARVREILATDPLRPFHAMWPTFLHIWKAQYVEDLFIKQSFFTRPLRETAALGLFGDVLWLVFTLAGLIGLVAPAREGLHNRLFALAWLGYSLLTVLIFHVEPRYLLPIWTLLGLYGAGTLARIRPPTTDHRPPTTDHRRTLANVLGRSSFVIRPSAVAEWLIAIAFVILVVTYRDYPAIIATGLERERAMVAGDRAYTAGDYAAAERSFRAALAAQPDFVDAQAGLALALAAQGRPDEAAAAVTAGGSRRADLVGSVLALRAGDDDDDAARSKITRIEASAGESIQTWAMEWMRPPPTTKLHLGDQRDIGYISGFSRPEEDAGGSFRWLGETGRIILPLPEPAAADATVALRVSGGRPGATPLEARIGDGPVWRVPIEGGQWRVYRLPIPPALAGQTRLAIELRAPPFIPAFVDPSSQDLRVLSVRVSDVRVE